MTTVDDVRQELERLSELLADLAIDRLHEALASTDERDRLAYEERQITRARNAVAKAINLLRIGPA